MTDARAVDPHIGGKRRAHPIDAAVAALAGRQHGVVSRRQLLALGAGPREIERRLEARRLHALYRGVYAVGHTAVSREARWLAAVLASGAGAVLSYRSAAALWDIRQSARGPIEVSVPVGRRSRRGIEARRSPLRHDEVTLHGRIPVTTPARTLLDLAAILTPHRLERALARAEHHRLADTTSLDVLLVRYPRRAGTPALRRILADRTFTVTRSELEDRFLAFLDHHGLPRPQTNVALCLRGRWIEVDCLWAQARLVVELDGYGVHGTRAAFESDRARDRVLQAAGFRVLRVTWRQLAADARSLASDLAPLLGS